MQQEQNPKSRQQKNNNDISVELENSVTPNTPIGAQTEAAGQLRVDETGPGALTNKSSSFNIMPEQAVQPRPELAQQPNVNVPKPAVVNVNPVQMPQMRQAYTELNALNAQLVGGYKIRAGNHELLLATLKEVNQMIQKAANLRAGAAKARVIADCRAAVKANNMKALFKIFKMGHDCL